MEELSVVVRPDGRIEFVYDDRLAQAFAGEQLETRRASHVEPHVGGGWYADMRPSGGGLLFPGVELAETEPVCLVQAMLGFATRQQALDAERQWLRERKGL